LRRGQFSPLSHCSAASRLFLSKRRREQRLCCGCCCYWSRRTMPSHHQPPHRMHRGLGTTMEQRSRHSHPAGSKAIGSSTRWKLRPGRTSSPEGALRIARREARTSKPPHCRTMDDAHCCGCCCWTSFAGPATRARAGGAGVDESVRCGTSRSTAWWTMIVTSRSQSRAPAATDAPVARRRRTGTKAFLMASGWEWQHPHCVALTCCRMLRCLYRNEVGCCCRQTPRYRHGVLLTPQWIGLLLLLWWRWRC
jgi:hypothetical protein